MKEFYNKYFIKQKMMTPVIGILVGLTLIGTYLFGLRALLLTAVNVVVACLVEYISNSRIYGRDKVSQGAIVTAMLFTLTLPVSIPLWISVIGMAFGIFIGKMVFGGFGRNIFNPALVGRVFIYINFPNPMTIYWNEVSSGFPGGFTKYLTGGIDTLSTATPMLLFRNEGGLSPVKDLLIGTVSGSIGETCKIVIIIGAIYLIFKKVASWEIMAGSVLGFVILSLVLTAFGFESVLPPQYGLIMGGFLFGTVLMATDPISAAKTTPGKWIYGIIVGLVTVVIRSFALFSGGMMFAILIGNTFAPIIDYGFNKHKESKKAKLEENKEKKLEDRGTTEGKKAISDGKVSYEDEDEEKGDVSLGEVEKGAKKNG